MLSGADYLVQYHQLVILVMRCYSLGKVGVPCGSEVNCVTLNLEVPG